MSQGGRIAARELFAAAAAFAGLENPNLVAGVAREQRPLVFGVSRLSAPLLLGFWLRGRRPGVRMLGGSEEFCGVFLRRASSWAIWATNISTNVRTAGVISASTSAGIDSGSASGMPLLSPKSTRARRSVW